MADAVRSALDIIAEALDRPTFDLTTAQRRITILTNEYIAATLLPRILGERTIAAPGIDLCNIPASDRDVELMDKGQADFAMSTYKTLPDRFESIDIGGDSYVLVMPANHPLEQGAISLRAYAAAKHVSMRASGDTRGFVDGHLDEQGLTRRVAFVVNQFLTILSLIKSANAFAAVPKRYAVKLSDDPDLAMRDTPVKGSREYLTITITWNPRLAIHPAQKWFLEFIRSLLLDG